MKKKSRILALLLTACMLLSLLPMGAVAGKTADPNMAEFVDRPGDEVVTELPGEETVTEETSPDGEEVATLSEDVAPMAESVGAVTTFAFLKAQIEAQTSPSNVSYTLVADLTATDTITVPTGATVSITGQKITRDTTLNKPVFSVPVGSLTFTNITLDGGAVWSAGTLLTRTATNTSTAQFMTIGGTGAVVLDTGAVLQNHARTTCAAQTGHHGGAIYVSGGSLTMKADATIQNCDVTDGIGDGGAVAVWGGTFNMTGGTITGNTASRMGGAIRVVAPSATMTMSGGAITGNAVHGKSMGSSYHTWSGGVSTGNKLTLSGAAVVTGNTDEKGAPANVVGGFVSGGLTSGAHIGTYFADENGASKAGVVATGVNYADLSYIYADTPATTSLVLGNGTALGAGAKADLKMVATPGLARIKASTTQNNQNLPATSYPTFAEAVTACTGGALDNDATNEFTIELLADCVSGPGFKDGVNLTVTGETDPAGKPIHTLKVGTNNFINGIGTAVALENIKLAGTGAQDIFHVYAPMTVTNCAMTVATPANGIFNITNKGSLNLVSGTFTAAANGKITSGASFTMKTGDGTTGVTTPAGIIKLTKGAKITLSAGSTAPANDLNIQVDNTAAVGDVIATATANDIATAVADKMKVNSWGTEVVGNDIKLAKRTVCYVLPTGGNAGGNDTTGDGTFAKPYATLEKAYSVLADVGEIRVLHNLTQTENVVFNGGKTVTISTWTRFVDTSAPSGFRVEKGALANANGAWTITRGDALGGVMLSVNGNATLMMDHIVLDGGNRGISLARILNVGDTNDGAGTVTIGNGATLQNSLNTGSGGGGAFVFGNGTLNLNGGTIKNCKATASSRYDGGGVYVAASGKLNLNEGSTITGCHASYGGGVLNSGVMVINGGTISKNTTEGGYENGRGGGIFVNAAGTLTIKGGDITENRSAYGGGIYIRDTGTVTTEPSGDINIKNNVAYGDGTPGTGMGGGVYLESSGVLTFSTTGSAKNITIRENKSGDSENNLYLVTGDTVTYSHDDAANIGITMQTPGDITGTEVNADRSAHFVSDSNQYKVIYATNKLVLVADPNAYVAATGDDTNGDGSLAKPYATIGKAYTALTATGGEIRLLSDVTQSAKVTFATAAKTFTLRSYTAAGAVKGDGNWTVTRDKALTGDHLFSVTAGDVILQGITVDGNKKEVATVNPNGNSRALFNVTGGTLTLDAGAILQNNHGGVSYSGSSAGAIVISGSCTVTMNAGATIQNNVSASYGGAVLVGKSNTPNAAKFVMDGGLITKNAGSEQVGNAVCIWGGNFVMNGGSVTENDGKSAGAVGIDTAGTVKLSGNAIISGNTQTIDGVTVPSNLYLWAGKTAALESSLTNGASIGVTTQTAPGDGTPVDVVVKGTANVVTGDAGYFFADNPKEYGIKFADDSDAAKDKIVLYKLPNDAYVANGDAGEGCTTAGNDDAPGDGTKDHPYATIGKAYAQVKNGGTIYVMDDLTATEVTNFNTINGVAKNVTITSCKGDGTVWAAAGDTNSITRNVAGSLFTINAGTITLKNITIGDSSHHTNSPVCITAPGKLILETGATVQNTESNYGAVYIFSGTLEMKAGSVIQNNTNKAARDDTDGTMKGAGAGVTLQGTATDSANLVMFGGTITGNKMTHASGIGGGVYVGKFGTITVSGAAKIMGNKNSNSAPSNVYLPDGKTIAAEPMTAGASINVSTQTKPATGKPIQIATNVREKDTPYFHADEMGKAGPRYATGSEPAESVYLDVTNKAVVQTTNAAGTAFYDLYETFDAAMDAIRNGDATNNGTANHYTLELLGDCTTAGNWPAVDSSITGPTADGSPIGAPKYTLTNTGLIATQNAPATSLKNIRLIAKDGNEWFHAYAPLTVENCELTSFAVVGSTATVKSGKVIGNIRVDNKSASQLSMKAGAVEVTGEIQFSHADGKVTLLAGSDATKHYNVRYAKELALADSKVVMVGATDNATAKSIAKNVSIFGGSDAAKEWIATDATTTVVLKQAKSYWVSEQGDDSANGTFATPFKTIEKAYTAGALEVGLDIRVLSDLPATAATTFANKDITSVKISSYKGENTVADKPWTIARKDIANPLLTVTKGAVNLTNITLDGNKKTVDATAALVSVGTGTSLTLNDGATIQNNKNKTNDGLGGGVNVTGTLTMNPGSQITGNTLTGTGATYGGGVYVGTNGVVTMNGGEISDNSVTAVGGSGGGIFMVQAATPAVTITGDAKIFGNSCGANGSAIHGGTAGSKIILSGNAKITGNRITGENFVGGAVFISAGELIVSGGVQISGNTNKEGNFCNVYLPNGKTVTIGAGQMGESASLGVYCQTMPDAAGEQVVIAVNAVETDGRHFTSDKNTDAGILYKDETVLLSYDERYIPPTGGGGNGGNGGNGGGDPNIDVGPDVTVEPGGNHGKVTTRPKNPDPGTKVTITVEPETGWEIGTVTVVTDPGGEPVTVTGTNPLTYIAPDPNKVKITITYKRTPVAPGVSGVDLLLETTKHLPFMVGNSFGKFTPDAGISRAETAQMFYNLLKEKPVVTKAYFTDVAADAWYADAVNVLAELGILDGRGDGLFCPEERICRSEFVTIAARFGKTLEGETTFTDVPETYWAVDNIKCAAQYGWISGYDDGTFKPLGDITRSEAAKVVNNMLGRFPDKVAIDKGDGLTIFQDVDKEHWAYYDIAEATNGHEFTKEKDKNNVETWTK